MTAAVRPRASDGAEESNSDEEESNEGSSDQGGGAMTVLSSCSDQ